MRFLKQTIAALVFAGLALSGTHAGADPVGFITFSVVGHGESLTFLRADVDPSLGGKPMMVRFGEAPGTGMYVGGKTLQVGTNYLAVPTTGPGWYTAEADGRSSATNDPGNGLEGLN